MTVDLLLVLLAIATPAIVAAWLSGPGSALSERAAVGLVRGGAGLMGGLSLWHAAKQEGAAYALSWPAAMAAGQGAPASLLGSAVVEVDATTALLLSTLAAIWAVISGFERHSGQRANAQRRTAWAMATATACLATPSPLLLCLGWCAGSWLMWRSLDEVEPAACRRALRVYILGATGLFMLGVALAAASDGPVVATTGIAMIVVATLVRKGVAPFHAWMPALFEVAPASAATSFTLPQIGAHALLVLALPSATEGLLSAVAVLALITAVYAAAQATIESDARRACGDLFVSQSALVMAGLDCNDQEAMTGAFAIWICAALATTGLLAALGSVEARFGRVDLERYHGAGQTMPKTALSFVILGLAASGVPGTLGFVGAELLVGGATEGLSLIGLCVVGASALTGFSVLRMYFRVFGGPRAPGVADMAVERAGDWLAPLGLALLLVAGGVLPGALLHRFSASAALHGARRAGVATCETDSAPSRCAASAR